MRTALYRRYRPETFQEVIGQEHVTVPLMAALDGDRTNHAYLFSGPRGCGKTTSARILARCLNCANGPTSTPCGTCESCVELSRGGSGSLDVVEMDAASHGGVDDARELRERASFAPARDRFKIFIIDEAHMVSNQGFNALLKLVEEPPEHVKFIFATTEPEKVIGTIRSRTHHYPFRLVPPDTLEGYLAEICRSEGIEASPGVLPLVVRAGTGSVRDTLSVLDQLMGGAVGDSLDYAASVSLLGYTDGALLDEAVDAMASSDGAALYSAVDNLVQSGHDPRRFAEDLLARLRDLVVLSLAGDAARDVLSSVPADQLERMKAQADSLGPARASKSADLVNAALGTMVGATSPRLQLELLCARLLVETSDQQARPANPVADPRAAARSFGKKKEASAHKPQDGPVAPPQPPAKAPAEEPAAQPAQSSAPAPPEPAKVERLVPEPKPDPTSATPKPDEVENPGVVDPVASLRNAWGDVMSQVLSANRRTRELIQLGKIAGVNAEGVTLGYEDNQLLTEFHRDSHARVFEDAIKAVTGLDMSVTTDPSSPRESSDDQEDDLPLAPEPEIDEDDESWRAQPGQVSETQGEDAGDAPAGPAQPEAPDRSPIPDFASVNLPPAPPAAMPDFSAMAPPPSAAPFSGGPKQGKDFSSLGSKHAIDRKIEPEVELDPDNDEDLVSDDDPMAVDVDGIGLKVVINQFEGTVLEEEENA